MVLKVVEESCLSLLSCSKMAVVEAWGLRYIGGTSSVSGVVAPNRLFLPSASPVLEDLSLSDTFISSSGLALFRVKLSSLGEMRFLVASSSLEP